MSRNRFHIYLLILPFVMAVTGCQLFNKKTNWNVSLSSKSKNPYGAYLAFASLPRFFPMQKVSSLSPGFRYTSIDDSMINRDKSLFLAVGLDFYLSDLELQNLLDYTAAGNELVIFARTLDPRLEELLGFGINTFGTEERPLTTDYEGKANKSILSLSHIPGKTFGYHGRSLQAHFIPLKPTNKHSAWKLRKGHTDTIGRYKGKPNILRMKYGKGHLTVHAAPLVLSNYFLLQEDNYRYLEGIWQALSPDVSQIYWNDFFKRSDKTADLGLLLQYPGTRWAFYLTLFGLLMYVLFESKRRQRIVPEIPKPVNSSVSFVETIGRLYYNKGDHSNIGQKMTQHFLEWVRAHYYIHTHKLDEHFVLQLIHKSGLPENSVRSLVDTMREVYIERKPIDEHDLYHLYHSIQQFYNNHKS